MNANQQIFVNSYIPKNQKKRKHEWYEHDLMTYIDDLKYDRFVKDMISHFSCVKVINFDIIHHRCSGDKLQNPQQYYEIICNKDFENYESHIQNQAVSSAIKYECDNTYFEHGFLKNHIKSNIEKDLVSNGIFVRKSIKNKNH